MKKAFLSWMILFACNLIWSFQFTCIKLTQQQVGPYFTVWAPMLVASILLAPFVIRNFQKGDKQAKDILVFVQLAILGAFPSQVLMTWGTQYSLASNAAILALALPVVTAVFAFLLLNEKMNKIRWLSFIVAIIGVLLCSTNDIKKMDLSSDYALGNLLIFLAIVGNAYYNVGCKQIAEKYTEVEMVFYTYLIMVILLAPLVVYYEPEMFLKVPHFTSQTWTGMIALTLFHNFLSMIMFFKVLKFLDATQVALSNYLITFMGLPIAAFILGESLNSQAIIGGILVLASTLILTIVDNNAQQRKLIN
ncbi:DMT family transporter [Dyadobacter flavalbus]|uniref:DMT family transporter n=1 Tax=Dyadobacter flavalbus TaxID=2579942 RepID=A0A5M8R2Y4_9BACT|nr:DMT family transporter [Dyadobacter flavalbus]KAA6441828.1 DMT family transporter [Dyadobacter flavalbus]